MRITEKHARAILLSYKLWGLVRIMEAQPHTVHHQSQIRRRCRIGSVYDPTCVVDREHALAVPAARHVHVCQVSIQIQQQASTRWFLLFARHAGKCLLITFVSEG